MLEDTKSLLSEDSLKINNILEMNFLHINHIFSNKGKLLINYKLFNKQMKDKNNLEALNYIGKLDMYCSVVSLINEFKDKNNTISYTNYLNEKKPCSEFEELCIHI